MNIGSIFVALGFKANTKDLNTFNAGIKSLKTNIIATSIAFTGAVYSVKKFLDSGINTASAITNFTNQTGLAVDKLNQFTQAGQSVSLNLNSDNIMNDIMNLEKTIAKIKIGQGSIGGFQMLGIDVLRDDAFDVLEQLRTNLQGLDDITATIMLENIGLNPNFLQVLKLSNAEFEKLSKNNFLNQKQVKTINQLGLNMRNLTIAFANLKNQAIAKLAPYFNDLINKTFKWLNQNGSKIVNVINDITKGFGIFVQGIARGVGFAGELVGKIFGIENGFKALAVGVGILLLPFKKLTTALLILEDIWVWTQGGNSAFGGFYDRIERTLDELKQVFDTIGIIFNKLIEKIDAGLQYLGIGSKTTVATGFEAGKTILGSMGDFFKDLPHLLFVPGETGAKENLDYMKNFSEKLALKITGSQNVNNTNNISINVNGVSNDGKAIAEDIANKLDKEIKLGTAGVNYSI